MDECQKVDSGKVKRQKVDRSAALKLKVTNGLTYEEIAAIQGVSKQAVHKALQGLLPTEDTDIYRSKRGDILAEMQRKILDSIDYHDIKKSPLGSRIVSAGILYDKERLERGLPTSILSSLSDDELDKRLVALREAVND